MPAMVQAKASKGLPWWSSGLMHCHVLLAVSDDWGLVLMANWSNVLPLTARCLPPLLRACPDGLWSLMPAMVQAIASRGLPWWSSGLMHCHVLLAVSDDWGLVLMANWSNVLPLTARCLPPLLRACPDGLWSLMPAMVQAIASRGLPWWSSGLIYCHWLLTVSDHWGPAPVTEWS